MRNFLGGLLAVVVGSTIIVVLLGITQPEYPEPFSRIWFLLVGSSTLQNTLFNPLTPLIIILYILAWLIIGVIIGPFSKPGWNTMRSALWVGLIHGILALASLLLLDSSFWDVIVNPDRNLDLLYQFTTSLILSVLTLPSAIPIAMMVDRLGKEAEPPIPSKIETVCECGAVFRSKPIMCSECGRTLNATVE